MKGRDYWKKRMEALEDESYRRSMAYYKDVEEQFRQASNGIQADIEKWYLRLAENNGISYTEAKRLLKGRQLEEFHWTVEQYIKAGEENGVDQRWRKELENASARHHIDYLQAMDLQIRQHVEELYAGFDRGLRVHLGENCKEQYYRTAWEVSAGTGVGFDLARLDTRGIDALLKHPWAQDGKVFSDRIWSNKEKLVNTLHTELSQCIIRGEPPLKAAERLAKKMNVGRAQAGNLIMTESAAIASAAQKECFHELGVEEYEFDATLDGDTCETCQAMDGKCFPMAQFEVGVSAPPVHPRCRCCVLPSYDDWEEFGGNVERAARDPETGKTVYVDGSLNYGEWKKKCIDSTSRYIAKDFKSGTLNTSASEEVSGMYVVGKINREIFKCITDNIVTDEVIITDNQIRHIKERHPEVLQKTLENLRLSLEEPDYIIKDKHKDTGLVIKKLRMEEGYSQIVLRICTSEDKKGYKNSIISSWEISEKRLQNYLRNKQILYKRE